MKRFSRPFFSVSRLTSLLLAGAGGEALILGLSAPFFLSHYLRSMTDPVAIVA